MTRPVISVERKITFINSTGRHYEVEPRVIISETKCPAAGGEYTYISLADGSQITALTDSIRELVIISEVKQ